MLYIFKNGSELENVEVCTTYLVSDRGPYGFVEELDADDWEQTDAGGQNDGQPQVGLPQGVRGHTCQPQHNTTQHNNMAMSQWSGSKVIITTD